MGRIPKTMSLKNRPAAVDMTRWGDAARIVDHVH